MDYQAFQNKYIGQTIDFDHDFQSSAIDLVRQYLYEVHQINIPLFSAPIDFWNTPPNELANRFYKIQDTTVKAGDIVVFTNTIGIASGNQHALDMEILEQNGEIRLMQVDKSSMVGILRHVNAPDAVIAPEVVQEVEPEIKEYKAPPGALNVPLNRVKFTMVVKVPGYDYISHAQKAVKPTTTLLEGTYYMTRQENGVARCDKGEGTKPYWFNPADNVLPPVKPDYYKDTREGYQYYDEPIRYKFIKRGVEAYVDSFAPNKKHVALPYNYRIWIGGTCVVRTKDGDILYGLPLNQVKTEHGTPIDNEFTELPSYSVRMSYLEIDQQDYVPDDVIRDVQPAAAAAFAPRDVTVKDYSMVIKGKSQRFIDGFVRRKK